MTPLMAVLWMTLGATASPADADTLEGRWQVTWTRPEGWWPQEFTGRMDLERAGDEWRGHIAWDQSTGRAALETVSGGGPTQLQFAWGDDTFDVRVDLDDDGLSGVAATGAIEPSSFTARLVGRPAKLPGPVWVPRGPVRSSSAAPEQRRTGVPMLAPDGQTLLRTSRASDGTAALHATLPGQDQSSMPLPPLLRHLVVLPGGGYRALTRDGRVYAVEPDAPRFVAALGSAPLWAEPHEDGVVVALQVDGGLRVVELPAGEGPPIERWSHPHADRVALDQDLQVRAWGEVEVHNGGLGAQRALVELFGPDGKRWGFAAQPVWVRDAGLVPRIGDAPLHMLAGWDLAQLGTVDRRGFKALPSPGAWGDATRLLVAPDGTIDAVGWYAERLHWDARTEAGEELLWLGAQLQRDVSVGSRSADDRTWVVHGWSGAEHLRSWLFDRDRRSLVALDPEEPGHPVEALVLEARDGHRLAAYLTRPASQTGPLPLIVHIHGGPWSGRHSWNWSAASQGWAEQGYAVLEVNFRGGRGFGWRETHRRPRVRFGEEMIRDLEDGIAWAIREGHADPERVAAVGSSYGGYAGLTLATAPEPVVRCTSAGLVRGNLVVPGGGLNVEMMGSLRWRRAHSPDEFTDRLTGPVLVWNGGLDGAHADVIGTFVERARGHRKEVTWIRFPWEAHGLREPANRGAMEALEDQFLAACLGGIPPPFPDDFGAARLEVRGDLAVPGLAERVTSDP